MNKSYASFRKITYLFNNFILRNIPHYKNLPHKSLFKNKIGPSVLLSVTGVNTITIIEDDLQEVDELANESTVDNFTNQIKTACNMSQDKLKELLRIIKLSIEKSCEEYRNCLQKQMSLLKKGTNADPLSEYWDEMVKQRVEASNLKHDINKFSGLIDYIEKVVFNFNVCQALIENNEAAIAEIAQQVKVLKEICEKQLKLNKDLENELLKLDRQHILFAKKK